MWFATNGHCCVTLSHVNGQLTGKNMRIWALSSRPGDRKARKRSRFFRGLYIRNGLCQLSSRHFSWIVEFLIFRPLTHYNLYTSTRTVLETTLSTNYIKALSSIWFFSEWLLTDRVKMSLFYLEKRRYIFTLNVCTQTFATVPLVWLNRRTYRLLLLSGYIINMICYTCMCHIRKWGFHLWTPFLFQGHQNKSSADCGFPDRICRIIVLCS